MLGRRSVYHDWTIATIRLRFDRRARLSGSGQSVLEIRGSMVMILTDEGTGGAPRPTRLTAHRHGGRDETTRPG